MTFNFLLTISFCFFASTFLVGQKAFIYEDKSGNWEIADAMASNEFAPTDEMSISSEITTSTFWIKITREKSFNNFESILFSNSINHFQTIYFQNTKDEITTYDFGVNQKNQSATLLPSFTLNKDIKNIYIKIKSDSFIFENFQIIDEYKANKNITVFIITQTSYFVIILLTFLYFCYAFFKSKKRILGYYLIYLFSLLFMFIYASNLGGYLIWEQLPFSSSYLESFGTTLMVTSYLALTTKIAQIKRISKVLYTAAFTIAGLSIGILLMIWLFADAGLSSKFANIYPGIGLLLILIFAIVGVVKKNKNAHLLFIGIISVFSSGVLKLSINWGIVNYSILLDFLTYLGFLIEVFIFTYLVLKYVEKEVHLTNEQRQKLEIQASEINALHAQLANLANSNQEQENNAGFNISPDINELLRTPLTPRELEVLLELANGGNYDDISERLFISKATLKSHIAKIYVKLDTKNRIDAINEALKLTAQLQEGENNLLS